MCRLRTDLGPISGELKQLKAGLWRENVGVGKKGGHKKATKILWEDGILDTKMRILRSVVNSK